MLNNEQKKTLLKLARDTIEKYITQGIILKFENKDPVLNEKRGAFVTIHNKGELRGCIGLIEGTQELYKTIIEMAIESATSDPRFPPLTPDELNDIDIEISVLTPLKKIKSIDEIILGKHGVIVKKGFRSGVFLPQVATETGWDKKTFLEHLCAGKAGLSKDAYLDKNTEIYIFEADVFGEKDIK
ncbi:MAG: AmmeMemoRadiSam system protein A [Candidatus Goldbacteria bacterium]|nr:AmmeMemoRadiSam system protein A [Candidatus Goldiibacteriota bacterium]